MKKTWQQKMETPDLPKVVPIPAAMQKRFGAGSMLIPSAREVEAAVRGLAPGTWTTVARLRAQLASQHLVETACPLVTGIFVRIVAEAAEEANLRTPWWRVVGEDGSLNPKFPGGVAAQATRLAEEGHRIVPGKGKKPPRVFEFPYAL